MREGERVTGIMRIENAIEKECYIDNTYYRKQK